MSRVVTKNMFTEFFIYPPILISRIYYVLGAGTIAVTKPDPFLALIDLTASWILQSHFLWGIVESLLKMEGWHLYT